MANSWRTWVPERWDVGQWGQAHWDGQLGIQAGMGSWAWVGAPANLTIGRRCPAGIGAFTFVGAPVTLTITRAPQYLVMPVEPGAFTFVGGYATLWITRAPLPPELRLPGMMVFGHPVILPRW